MGGKTKLEEGGAATALSSSDLFCCYLATSRKIDLLCYLPKFILPKYLPLGR